MKSQKALKKLSKSNLLPIAALTCVSAVSATLSIAFVDNAIAGALPDKILWGNPTCDVSTAEILRKHELRKSALVTNASNPIAQNQYLSIIQKHKSNLQICRDRTAPKTQATWIRLYPNDVKAGVLEDVFDKVANRGYNQVFIEVFYDGRGSCYLLPITLRLGNR